MNVYRHPLRFYGFQKLLGMLLAPLAVGVACWIVSGVPREAWSDWPTSVQRRVGQLASGLYVLAGLWWLWTLLRPWVRSRAARQWIVGVVGFFVGGLSSVWGVVTGSLGLLFSGEGHALAAAAIVGRVALLPLGCGVAVALWPDVKQRIKTSPHYRRWFVSGAGQHGGWAGPIAIAKHTRPLPKASETGHVASGVFIGRTNFEDTFGGGDEVFLEGPSHVCTIAQTGAGKHICAAPNYAMYRGSMVHCTVKPEAADQFLGARVDPALLPPHASGPSAGRYGVNPRGITKATRYVPDSRAYLLDVTGQSVYPSNRHTLLSEIDPHDINARVLALAIADGSFPELKSTSEPWFREAPRNFFAADILHALTASDDPRRQCLPRIIERAMGIDRLRGENGPQVIKTLLKEMVGNRHPNVGGFIQTTAVQVMELGERAYGTLKSEFQTNCSWALDPYMEQQLTGVSDFSYSELGDDEHPVTVFLVPPRGDAALRSALPWLRSQTELALQILQTNHRRPRIPTLFVCDEARQYLEGLSAVKNGLTLLRDARVKLWLMFQSWPSVIETLGQSAAVELEACSTMQFFGVNDLATAKRISERLGYATLKQKNPISGKVERLVAQVITPDEVLRELSLTSPLSYVMGGGVAPMRLRRVAYKPIVTGEGARFEGLPLTGQYDEGLSRYSCGGQKY